MNRIIKSGLRIVFLMTVLCYQLRSQCVSSIGSKITVPCTTPLASIPVPNPSNLPNCSGTVTAVNQILPAVSIMKNCDSAFFGVIFRVWKLSRTGKADTTYRDTVCLTKSTLATVQCPNDTVVYCMTAISLDTSVAKLGAPLSNSGLPCNILQIGPYDTLWNAQSKGCFKFTRTWNLLDWCNKDSKTCKQLVEVRDTIAPSVTIPDKPLSDVSVSGTHCDATLILPAANISDNCVPNNQLIITITIDGVKVLTTNGGTVSGIGIGTHQIVYTVKDGCNKNNGSANCGTDTAIIKVVDKQGPVALCKGPKIIQLPSSGMATLPATLFDDGSFDFCTGNIVTVKVRRMDDGCNLPNNPFNHFYDQVKFCCADAGKDIMVIMRVYQGVVDTGVRSRDEANLIFTDCMTPVKVQDKFGPSITCPSDTTIDCRDISKKGVKSLSEYGMATIIEMCLDSVWADSLPSLNDCNKGYITRKINARDKAGNISFCNQTITVVNKSPFNGNDPSDLAWPKDTTFFVCNAITTTAVTGVPIVTDPGCSKVAYKFEDDDYTFITGACKKIIRKWTLIDWCQIDPAYPYKGKWTHNQIIVVMDTSKPVMSGVAATLSVDDNDLNCGPVLVVPTVPSATDCTPSSSLIWSYTVDLYSDGKDLINGNGKNVSELMPIGMHILTYYVSDGCGNIARKSTKITVKDGKKPTPVAMNGLATDITLMNGVAMVRVLASQFFLPSSTFDNCTPFKKLRFSYSKDVKDTVRTYTCDSLGTRTVRLWVTDEAGNQDVVNTYILMQNNMGACPAKTTDNDPAPELRTGGIQGSFFTESGQGIQSVSLKLMHGNNALPDPLVVNSKYTADNMLFGQSYEVIPKKDINPLNGVSTADLIMIQKHILGISKLNTPYKLIAADIDRSGDINSIDLLELRKLLLGIDSKFNNNESWRFVDAGFAFNDLSTVLSSGFNEKYSIKDMNKSMQIDFIGVKIGDVNESGLPNELNTLQPRSNPKAISLIAHNQNVTSGDYVKLDFSSSEMLDYQGMQMAFLAEGLEVKSIESGWLSANTIHFYQENNLIRITAYQEASKRIPANTKMFSLVLKSTTQNRLSEIIQLKTNDLLNSELYNTGLESRDIKLEWKQSNVKDQFALLQNQPNPFVNTTTIKYFLPEASQVTGKIIDIHGRILLETRMMAIKGTNDWIIDHLQLPNSGIYYYRIESPYGTDANKMILAN